MAAAASVRRNNHPIDLGYNSSSTIHSYNTPSINTSSTSLRKKLTLSTSLGHAASRASPPPTASNKQTSTPSYYPDVNNMTSYTSSTTTIPPSTSTRERSKLHKRNSRSTSLPAPPSPLAEFYSSFGTPFVTTYEEPSSATSTPTSSTPKLKPYLRRLSSNKSSPNDGLDLSKSAYENGDTLAGLGINDFVAPLSASEVTFFPPGRRTTHARTTSTGSQISNGSGSYKPFVHPMRQTPSASYTSYASSVTNEEEVRESLDIVGEDDFRLAGYGGRGRRSVSISSTPQPTPLSQSHTAAELGMVTGFKGSKGDVSVKSGKSKGAGREGGNTGPKSVERERMSEEMAFSLKSSSKRSDPDQSNEDRIAALRRDFAEKEASKRQKREREEMKRKESDLAKEARKEERQTRRSEAGDRKLKSREGSREKKGGVKAKSYDSMRPGHITSLPSSRLAGYDEKGSRTLQAEERKPEGGWHKFVRAMSCGG